MRKIIISLIMLVMVSACSSRYASTGEHLYSSSQNGNPLVLPPNLTETNVSHFYDLPKQETNAVVNIAPPAAKENSI